MSSARRDALGAPSPASATALAHVLSALLLRRCAADDDVTDEHMAPDADASDGADTADANGDVGADVDAASIALRLRALLRGGGEVFVLRQPAFAAALLAVVANFTAFSGDCADAAVLVGGPRGPKDALLPLLTALLTSALQRCASDVYATIGALACAALSNCCRLSDACFREVVRVSAPVCSVTTPLRCCSRWVRAAAGKRNEDCSGRRVRVCARHEAHFGEERQLS
jgi:hypothetical protein